MEVGAEPMWMWAASGAGELVGVGGGAVLVVDEHADELAVGLGRVDAWKTRPCSAFSAALEAW
jgi:hypothetical protein